MRGCVLAAATLLLTAGCLGGDDATENEDATATDGALAPEDIADSAPPGDRAAPATVWQMDNRTGSINGVNAVVLVLSGVAETFGVAEGTFTLAVNLTITGGDVFASLAPPSCVPADPVEEAQQLLLGCADEVDVSTTGGQSSASIDGPEVGEWTLSMFCSSTPGPCAVDYAALIAQLVPA
jgi:hypothetical protein